MDFKFSEEQEKFRQEVRSFLEEEIRLGSFKPASEGWLHGYDPEFSKKLGKKGWIGLTWPKEYGGQERSNIDRFILMEEILIYGAPIGCHWSTERQVGGAVIISGTDEQKKDLLPKIARGEAYACVGMSEPESGSDLASLKTLAIEDNDGYVINGQKVWTSGASLCNYIYMVARTDPEAPKAKGISEFIFEMNLPGITVRPIIHMTGGHFFDEVFFDDVRIPKKCLIGEKNRGFYQLMRQYDVERTGLERLMGNYLLFQDIIQYVKKTQRNGKPLSQDTLVRQKLAQLQVEFEVGRLLTYRVAFIMDQGRSSNVEVAIAKTYCTEFEQRLANAAVNILGLYGQLMPDSKYTPLSDETILSYLASFSYTIQGGTSEILRNIASQRGLGLPSS